MEQKSQSLNITDSTEFKTSRGDLLQYNEDLTVKGFDNPTITLTASEDLGKHQKGIVRITVEKEHTKETYLVHVDGMMSVVYASYAKTLNDLKKPTFRMKTLRVIGFIKKLWKLIKN